MKGHHSLTQKVNTQWVLSSGTWLHSVTYKYDDFGEEYPIRKFKVADLFVIKASQLICMIYCLFFISYHKGTWSLAVIQWEEWLDRRQEYNNWTRVVNRDC